MSRLSSGPTLVALTALTIVFDGADIQLLGAAVPAMMREWDVTRATFAPILATGLIGMLIGAALAGVAGDCLGRRVALIGSVLVFGLLTLAVAIVDNLLVLGALRFIAGLGLGGAVPNAVALASEYVPVRHRPFAVTLTIVCVPLGGTLAGLLASRVLPVFGWRMLFTVGGVLPLVLATALVGVLPESPRFLARDPAAGRASFGSLLTPDRRRNTLALWAAFGSCLLAVYAGFNWLPSMLTGAGLDLAVASTGLAAFNLGGVAGGIAGAFVIARIGSKPTMLTMAAGSIAGALALATMSINANSAPAPILLMIGTTGGLINAVQITLYALAAHVYPTAMRATGVGSAAAVGRLGAILSTYAGARALESGGSAAFFTLIAASMTATVVSLALLRDHIPRSDSPDLGSSV